MEPERIERTGVLQTIDGCKGSNATEANAASI